MPNIEIFDYPDITNKGAILADTNDGKYYRIQITDGADGAIEVIDLTD
uniref:Uncharacterized protein n=1 Tax=viral metagenome TaxID=1070528 RepID=A0A6M3XGV7_9ZZZZ